MIRKCYRIFLPVYTVFMLYLMFFGFGRSQYLFNIVRLVPFVSTWRFMKEALMLQTVVINIFGNILMFVPFGFLGVIFKKLDDFRTLILNFLSVILIIETLQYFSRLGVFDIDDIILNSMGVAVGFYLYRKVF